MRGAYVLPRRMPSFIRVRKALRGPTKAAMEVARRHLCGARPAGPFNVLLGRYHRPLDGAGLLTGVAHRGVVIVLGRYFQELPAGVNLRARALDEQIERPVEHDAQLVTEADEFAQVQGAPHEPSQESGRADTQQAHRGELVPDTDELTEVEVLEGLRRLTTQQAHQV